MAASSDAVLPKWLIFGAGIPLAPMLGVMLLRYVNNDKITWEIWWCDELACFSFEMALVMCIRCFTEIKIKSVTASKAWWARSGSIFMTLPCCIFFVTYCLSQTSVQVPLHMRWNLCKFLFGDIVALVVFVFTFPKLRRKIMGL